MQSAYGHTSRHRGYSHVPIHRFNMCMWFLAGEWVKCTSMACLSLHKLHLSTCGVGKQDGLIGLSCPGAS